VTKRHLLPQTALHRYQDGSGWCVEAVGDDGVPENIVDFSSEAEARNWIKSAVFFSART
jgi:hypothetical protein